MSKIDYPVRARIIDVAGEEYGSTGFRIKTPDVSLPHVGKEGLAEDLGGRVRITLDDGSVLWGSECWWTPIETATAGKE